MSDGIIKAGEKLHIITRRLFMEDVRRHFAGEVTFALGAVIRAQGYTFVFNPVTLEYRRRPELRTRVFSLGDGAHIVNVIPPDTRIEKLRYELVDQRLTINDGESFSLDINEFGSAS